jgi:hypothetical protein
MVKAAHFVSKALGKRKGGDEPPGYELGPGLSWIGPNLSWVDDAHVNCAG